MGDGVSVAVPLLIKNKLLNHLYEKRGYMLEYEILIDDVEYCPPGSCTYKLYQCSLSYREGRHLHNNYSLSFK